MFARPARILSTFGSIAVIALCSTACIEDFGATTAYEDQRFLCDEEYQEEWNEEVELCTELYEDQECGGVISFRGTLESQPIAVETRLVDSAYKINQNSFGIFGLSTVDAVGPTPYFTLSFKLDSIGRTVSGERTLELDQGARSKENHLEDEAISASLRLTAGGDSVSLGGRTGSGQVQFTVQDFVRIAGTFHGAFGGEEDEVEGCFFIKPIESFLTIE